MRTDFHAILRHEAQELNRAQIDAMTWDEARNYYWANKDGWKRVRPKDSRLTVCFTGFTVGELTLLTPMAEAKNLRIVKSVVNRLHY